MSDSISIGAATDHIFALAQQAISGVTIGGQAAVAVDGQPDQVVSAMFVVGLSMPPPDVEGETAGTGLKLSFIGTGAAAEDYVIPCYIDVRCGGTKVQKTPRDIAVGIFQTFYTAFVADISLGGVLNGLAAEIGAFSSLPANLGTVSEPGRRQFISFGVHCRNIMNLN